MAIIVVVNPVTWNPLDKGSNVTLSNGNLTLFASLGWNNGNVRATKGISSGKWYWEIEWISGTMHLMVGIGNSSASLTTYDWSVGSNNVRLYCIDLGTKYPDGVSYGSVSTVNVIIG